MASSLKGSEYENPPGRTVSQKCWVVFEEISKNNVKCSIKCATAVTPLSITLMCGLDARYELENNSVVLDDWFEFIFSTSCENLVPFRSAIAYIVDKKITNPRAKLCVEEDEVIKMLATMLSIEDVKYGLRCPEGIGSRPKLLHAPITTYEENYSRRRSNYTPQHTNNRDYQGRNNNRAYNNNPRNNPYTQSQQGWNNKNQGRNQQWYNGNQSRGSSPIASTSNGYGNNRHGDAGPSYYNDTPYSSETRPLREQFNSLEAGPSQTEKYSLNASYFVIKPIEVKNISIAMAQNTWNFAPQTEKQLFKEFARGQVVNLIFSARGSTCFNGVARLISNNMGTPNHPCPIRWMTKNTIQFDAVKYYIHPKIHAREDGTQLSSDLGRQLCMDIEGSNNDCQRAIVGKFYRKY